MGQCIKYFQLHGMGDDGLSFETKLESRHKSKYLICVIKPYITMVLKYQTSWQITCSRRKTENSRFIFKTTKDSRNKN